MLLIFFFFFLGQSKHLIRIKFRKYDFYCIRLRILCILKKTIRPLLRGGLFFSFYVDTLFWYVACFARVRILFELKVWWFSWSICWHFWVRFWKKWDKKISKFFPSQTFYFPIPYFVKWFWNFAVTIEAGSACISKSGNFPYFSLIWQETEIIGFWSSCLEDILSLAFCYLIRCADVHETLSLYSIRNLYDLINIIRHFDM